MEYKGRFILGDTVQLSCLARDGARTPTLPDLPPTAAVTGDSGAVATFRLPACDRYAQAGFFSHPLVLDARFAAGRYDVVYQWTLSGVMYSAAESFEVVAGGHPDGPGLALYWFAGPTADFVVLQTDGGRLVRRRNPRL